MTNTKIIAYFKDWEAVLSHLLEGDHKNFSIPTGLQLAGSGNGLQNRSAGLPPLYFSRLEVFSYSEHPLQT